MKKAKIESIKSLAESGLYGAQIAKQLGMSRQLVHQYCKIHGIPVKKLKEVNELEVAWVQKLLDRGLTQAQIGVMCNCSPTKVNFFIKKHGLKKSPQ